MKISEAQISQRIRQARQKVGLSQGLLANRCGVSQPVISRIEAAKRHPSRHELTRIVKALEEAFAEKVDGRLADIVERTADYPSRTQALEARIEVHRVA